MKRTTMDRTMCQFCEKPFWTYERKAKYCSMACYGLQQRKGREESWNHGMTMSHRKSVLARDEWVSIGEERYVVENTEVRDNLSAETLMWDEWDGSKVIVGYRHG